MTYFWFLLFILSSFIVGYALLLATGLTKLGYRHLIMLSAPIGFAVNSAIAALAYFRLDIPSAYIRLFYLGVTALALIYVIIELRRNRVDDIKEILLCLVVVIVGFTIMLTPGLYRGEKYYAYKGNIYDKYAYLSEVAYMTNYDEDFGNTGMKDMEWYPDALDQGYYYVVNDRPIAALVCASIYQKGDLFWLGYLYMSMAWSFILCPMSVLAEAMFPKLNKWIYPAFSAAYTLGFHAQLQNDIDAWSQVCGASVLIAFTVLWFMKIGKIIYEDDSMDWKYVLGMGIIGAGCFLIYAEATWAFGFVIVIATVFLFFRVAKMRRIKEYLKALIIPVLMLVITLLVHFGTFRYAFAVVRSSNSAVIQTWTGFLQYWYGYHEFIASSGFGEFIKKLFTIIPCWCGMYMLTPIYSGISMIVIGMWLMAMMALSAGLTGIFIYVICALIKKKPDHDSYMQTAALSCGISSVIVFLLYIVTDKWYTGSKALLYLSPFIFVLFAYPLMDRVAGSLSRNAAADNDNPAQKVSIAAILGKKTMVVVSGLFLACQVLFLAMRLYGVATDENGILKVFGSNYPNMERQDKEIYPFDFDEEDYSDAEVVAIRGGDTYYQTYIKLKLAYKKINCYVEEGSADDSGTAFSHKYREGDPVIDLSVY